MDWFFWRRKDTDAEKRLQELMAWEANRTAAGWRHWLYSSPPSGEVIEINRIEWPSLYIVKDAAFMHPATNISGLWWRPCLGEVIDYGGTL